MQLTDNLNIKQFRPLLSPRELKERLPQSEKLSDVVANARRAVADILTDRTGRRIVITGPCSLHDRDAAIEYVQRLKKLQDKTEDKLLIIMRAYFEKPRTTVGWKGMLYDPVMDGSYDIETGFSIARSVMLEIAEIGLPIATEFLDPIVPQYLADMVTWAAIGARTTESQVHRQMASGLSMPIGFKNAMDGSLMAAVQAVGAAQSGHSFMGIDSEAKVVIAETKGNKYGHLVMRGGASGPNYASEYVAFAGILLQKAGIENGLIIDCSHANSNKDHKLQGKVLVDVCDQIKQGDRVIAGVMLESFLDEGNQPVNTLDQLKYGVSVTDKCICWDETENLILHLAEVV